MKLETEILKAAKRLVKENMHTEQLSKTKIGFRVDGFSGVYNLSKGGGMSLNNQDKKWIKDAIKETIIEALQPVVKKIDDLTAIVKKNHPDDFAK